MSATWQSLGDPSAVDAVEIEPEVALERPIPGWRRLAARRRVTVSIGVLVVVAGASLLAPFIAPHDPLRQQLSNAGALPTLDHLLGTDYIGRDILSRLMYGGAEALFGVFFCVLVAMLVGVPFGVMAGYAGGWFDTIGSTLSNLFQTLPGVVAMLMAVSIFGTQVYVGMGVLGVLLSAGFFRLARNGAQAIRRDLFVDASRVAGMSGTRIITRHVLPNVARPIIIQASLTATVALLLQAGLAFLGQGPPLPAPSWGSMVKEATDVMFRFPWIMVPPGGAIALTAFAFNLLGDALSDDALPQATAPRALSPGGVRIRRSGAEPAARPRGDDEVLPSAGASPGGAAAEALLSVRDLSVAFPGPHGELTVVDRMRLDIHAGEAVALVGESGCGKTMTALAVVGLLPARGRVIEGSVLFEGRDLAAMDEQTLSGVRGSRIGFVSQEPIASLDPSFTVGSQIAEPVRRHERLSRSAARKRALELLEMVEIPRVDAVASSYPHQLSGGMAQRVSIAIALSGRPRLLIADEPTTALDVTVQAEILELLRGLQQQTGVGLLLVTHDWGVVADIASRAAVMYAGQLVEEAPVRTIFANPRHPYTEGLLRSTPRAEHVGEALPTIRGSVPPPGSWPSGCRFQNRCPYVRDACREEPVSLVSPEPGRLSRCLLSTEFAGRGQ